MSSNGHLPGSELTPIPGGQLRNDAARSWIRMRNRIGKETGIWICPTSSRCSYRPYADQLYFWNLYLSGRGNLAARPGTSNHGWGTTVDLPSTSMRSAIDRYGASYGWSKRWSDAPSEWWHIRYDPSRDNHRGEPLEPKKPDYKYLQEGELKARRKLRRARRYARRHGWSARSRSNVRAYKTEVRRYRRRLIDAAREDGGWKKNHRRERYNALGTTLLGKRRKKK